MWYTGITIMCIEIYAIFCLFSENNNGNELRANDCLELENLVTASILDEFPMTTCVRCAVHTFQLSVYDTLKDRSISSILSKARKVSSNAILINSIPIIIKSKP